GPSSARRGGAVVWQPQADCNCARGRWSPHHSRRLEGRAQERRAGDQHQERLADRRRAGSLLALPRLLAIRRHHLDRNVAGHFQIPGGGIQLCISGSTDSAGHRPRSLSPCKALPLSACRTRGIVSPFRAWLAGNVLQFCSGPDSTQVAIGVARAGAMEVLRLLLPVRGRRRLRPVQHTSCVLMFESQGARATQSLIEHHHVSTLAVLESTSDEHKMSNATDLSAAALDSMRKRITKFLPGQIRQAVQQLTDEQIWWRPNPASNSVGNLILHLSGSIRNYLCRSVGGFDYTRDRAAEFAAQGPMPRGQLLAIFEEMVEQATRTVEPFDTARFLDGTEEPDYYQNLFDQICGVVTHLSMHTGQIIYVAKMLKAGSLDEIWRRAYNLE